MESFAQSEKRHYAVPLKVVHTYTKRQELSEKLEKQLQIQHKKASILYAVVLHRLGGAGKTQLALDYAKKHKD